MNAYANGVLESLCSVEFRSLLEKKENGNIFSLISAKMESTLFSAYSCISVEEKSANIIIPFGHMNAYYVGFITIMEKDLEFVFNGKENIKSLDRKNTFEDVFITGGGIKPAIISIDLQNDLIIYPFHMYNVSDNIAYEMDI